MLTFLTALIFTTAAAGHALRHRTPKTIEARVNFLEHAVSHHRYVCREGAWRLPTTRWHCLAKRWTVRELRAARASLWRHLPAADDWRTAVRVTQRVYPGTESWLLSCSSAEGGHGRWVRYGGDGYYSGYEDTDAVGGWMQFRPSTFWPWLHASLDYAQRHRFVIPHEARSWFSPLGQALTGGYMRAVAHNTGWHWAASMGNGC
jgi:hypothetical protein